jgi:prenylcysteine oxidase/farnesylcysteine lyase
VLSKPTDRTLSIRLLCHSQNLMRAVDRFNLSLVPFADDDRPSAGHDPLGMGLYDGSRFVLTTSSALGWWEKAKLLWRYGYVGPTRTRTAIDGLVASFKQMYDARWVAKNGPWETIEGLSKRLGLGDPTAVTGEDWFRDEVKVEGRFVDEMVEAVLRVNVSFSRRSLLLFSSGELTAVRRLHP